MPNDRSDRCFGDCAILVRSTVRPEQCLGRRYVALEHIEEGTLRLLDVGVGEEVTSAKAEFRAGDILFGKLRPYFRKVVRPRFDGVCSTDIWVVRAANGTDQGYLYYWMASKEFVEAATRGSTGTKMPRADWDFVSRLTLPVPPLPTQRRIAAILGSLDDKIELNRRMNRTLEKMAAAIFNSWFIDFDPVRAKAEGRDPGLPAEIADLFPDGFEDSALGPIPKGWDVSKFGDLIELAYGKSLRAQDRRPGQVAVYGSNGQVGWHDTALVTGPGIVVGRKGNPGIVTWAPSEFFPIDTTFYVVPTGPVRSLYFLYHALKNHDLASLGADSAVPGLNRNMVYLSQQVVPPSDLVTAFDSFVKPLCDRTCLCECQNRRLAGLRDTLLPKLLSGEIELPAAGTVTEEVGS